VECRKTTRFATSCQLFEFLKYISYLFKLRNLFPTSIDQVDNMENFEFSNENVINLVQNEPVLWDSSVNATEEEKEIAWKRIADSFGIPHGKIVDIIKQVGS